MEDITKNRCTSTISGYTKIKIAPAEEIESVDLIDINTKKVTFKPGGRFAELEVENIQFTNSQSDGAYERVITCEMRGTSPQLQSTFDTMTKKRFIVALCGRSSIWWLQGDMNEPMRFEYSQQTDSKPTGFTGYKLKFLRKTTLPICKLQNP